MSGRLLQGVAFAGDCRQEGAGDEGAVGAGWGGGEALAHLLVAVGYYKGDNALRKAIETSNDFLKHAKQTVEKPATYLYTNMLVDLDSRQVLAWKMSQHATFSEFLFQNFYQYCTEYIFFL